MAGGRNDSFPTSTTTTTAAKEHQDTIPIASKPSRTDELRQRAFRKQLKGGLDKDERYIIRDGYTLVDFQETLPDDRSTLSAAGLLKQVRQRRNQTSKNGR